MDFLTLSNAVLFSCYFFIGIGFDTIEGGGVGGSHFKCFKNIFFWPVILLSAGLFFPWGKKN